MSATATSDAQPQAFPHTRWTIVMTAGRSDTPRAQAALAELCQTYWYPLYAFIRQRGHAPHDAQDLTQEFFARLLEKNSLADITRERGKFRSFLLASLKHFLVDEWRKAQSAKRGGGRVVSLDAADAENRFAREPADAVTPEKLFEQNWALALLDAVYRRLQREYEQAGKGAQFAALKFCLTGARSAAPYADIAARLGLPENTVKTLVRRLRQHYRQLLRDEVAQSVAAPGEIEDELNCLFRAIADL